MKKLIAAMMLAAGLLGAGFTQTACFKAPEQITISPRVSAGTAPMSVKEMLKDLRWKGIITDVEYARLLNIAQQRGYED